MMRNRIPLLLGLFMALSISLTAAQVFILFDPACMDRLEYDMSRPDGKGDYLVYHVNIRSGEKLILEVGEESSREQNYLPEPYLYCNSGGFDQSLMRRINANIDEVYLVYPKSDKKFTISRVAVAAYYSKNGSVLSYDSPKYRFRFDTEFGTIGENIAINNPGAKVYFEGRLENDCTGSYLFRQLSPQSAYPLTDLVVTPELGIVEERSGANASAAANNTIVLNKVNGRSADRYIQEVCGTEPGSQKAVIGAQQGAANTVTNYNASNSRINPPGNLPSGAILPTGNVVNTPRNVVANTNQPTTSIMTETTPSTNGPSTHTVASGETLYGISRKYNVDVAEIKAWNNLSSNTIRRGQVLQVAPATSNTAPELVSRGFVNNTSQPTTLSGGLVPYDQSNTQRIMTDNQNMHIVKPGETVASIALEYGYTSKKFRDINELGPNDYVKVGQRLKTTDCDCATTTTNRAVVPNQTSTTTTPNSYNATGGRIAPSTDLVARTPAASSNVINPGSSQVVVRNSGGLTSYSPPTVPVTTTSRSATSNYNAIPNSYNAPAANRSMSALEEKGNSPRAIGNTTDFGNPVAPASTNRTATPSSYGSPYPSPNTPISYDAVRTSRPDEYYQPASTQRRIHVVASGESLYGIARRYGTTPEQLRRLNNLGPSDPIIEYQNLYIE